MAQAKSFVVLLLGILVLAETVTVSEQCRTRRDGRRSFLRHRRSTSPSDSYYEQNINYGSEFMNLASGEDAFVPIAFETSDELPKQESGREGTTESSRLLQALENYYKYEIADD